MARENKCAEGSIVTDKESIVGTGYTTYGQHHGTLHDKNAALQQGRNTTRLSGDDLQKIRKEISSFNYILGMTEKTTGMEVILADLLRQSSSNEGGRQEAMFTPHVDNDNDRPKSVLTAICLLSNTKTSMRICGKQEFFYQNMGHIAIFPSDIFHETVSEDPSTMKLAMFFCRPEKRNLSNIYLIPPVHNSGEKNNHL